MSDARRLSDDVTPIERLIRPLQVFAGRPLAGISLLIGATVVALVWANSPWASVYEALRSTTLTVAIGDFGLSKPLLRWVDDGLMGVFFFVIGLEIKREILFGELSTLRRASLPLFAALGGMVVPALLYASMNPSGPAARGWGVPMATDVAFALGVLALLGPRVPASAKILLTALAIVDDIGAILVIAVFYTDTIAFTTLGIGASLFILAIVANRLGVRHPLLYFIIGLLMWVAFLKSGVHATLAAVLIATVIPARGRLDGREFVDRARGKLDELEAAGVTSGRDLLSHEQQHVVEDIADLIEEGTAPVMRLEHALLPIATFLVLPTFALVNAGTSLGGDIMAAIAHPVSLGIVLGLVLGKQIGILAFSWFAVRLGIAELPSGVAWRHVHGLAALGGIGFTMSLFVGSLAFQGPDLPLRDVAKIGILLGSLLSGVLGWALLRSAPGPEHSQISELSP